MSILALKYASFSIFVCTLIARVLKRQCAASGLGACFEMQRSQTRFGHSLRFEVDPGSLSRVQSRLHL